jgi:chromosome segregation ATPase
MVQTEDHMMRSECAKEFGKIQTALDFHKEWREEELKSLNEIHSEIQKLTGNGWRNKIEDVSIKLSTIEVMLSTFAARLDASQFRIESLEGKTTLLEDRIFSTSLKVAGAVGIGAIVFQFIWAHIFGS